jgi:uncharacterized RDD family membrane protein YckC
VSPAGFWRRFAAQLVDLSVFLPVFVLSYQAGHFSAAVFLVIRANSILVSVYSAYFHSKNGQTLGKKLLGIRVVSIEGGAVTWERAWRREILNLVQCSADFTMTVYCVLALGALYASLEPSVRMERIFNMQPTWFLWVTNSVAWSDILLVLTNRNRRSLHDFIAGTRVIRVNQPSA